MLIVTTNDIPGHRIDAVFGEVMGLTVRSRDIGSQMLAGLRSLGGGELPEMTRALYESRQEVMARMVAEGQQGLPASPSSSRRPANAQRVSQLRSCAECKLAHSVTM